MLFTVWETPQACTGFTLFELLFKQRPMGLHGQVSLGGATLALPHNHRFCAGHAGANQMSGLHHEGAHPASPHGTAMGLEPPCPVPRGPARESRAPVPSQQHLQFPFTFSGLLHHHHGESGFSEQPFAAAG